MNTPSLGEIQVALRDGTLESADLDTLRRYLKATHGFYTSPTNTPVIQECASTLRAMIASKEAAADQKKVFRWAVIAGVAGIVAAVFGGIAVAPILHDWCKSSSQVLSPKADQPASIQLPPPALVSPTNYSAPSTNSPKTP
jgi:hypothetical protein